MQILEFKATEHLDHWQDMVENPDKVWIFSSPLTSDHLYALLINYAKESVIAAVEDYLLSSSPEYRLSFLIEFVEWVTSTEYSKEAEFFIDLIEDFQYYVEELSYELVDFISYQWISTSEDRVDFLHKLGFSISELRGYGQGEWAIAVSTDNSVDFEYLEALFFNKDFYDVLIYDSDGEIMDSITQIHIPWGDDPIEALSQYFDLKDEVFIVDNYYSKYWDLPKVSVSYKPYFEMIENA